MRWLPRQIVLYPQNFAAFECTVAFDDWSDRRTLTFFRNLERNSGVNAEALLPLPDKAFGGFYCEERMVERVNLRGSAPQHAR
jgi:hypothetical protein